MKVLYEFQLVGGIMNVIICCDVVVRVGPSHFSSIYNGTSLQPVFGHFVAYITFFSLE